MLVHTYRKRLFMYTILRNFMYSKSCPSCNKTIFYKNKSTLVRSSKLNIECRKCTYSKRSKMSDVEKRQRIKLYALKYKQKLQNYVWNYLSTHPCVDCGEKYILYLEFDHIENKKEWVSWLIRKHSSISEIKSEIDKCEVRCISCHRKRTHANHIKSKNKLSKSVIFIKSYLSDKKCIDCKSTDVDSLEFDHVRGQKTYNVSTLVGSNYSIQRILDEINKCDVVCCKCHRKRTATRAGWRILKWIDEYFV